MFVRKVGRKKAKHKCYYYLAHHRGQASVFIYPRLEPAVLRGLWSECCGLSPTNHSLIHLFIQYFLSTYYVPGTVVGTKHTVNKAGSPTSCSLPSREETSTKQTNKPTQGAPGAGQSQTKHSISRWGKF